MKLFYEVIFISVPPGEINLNYSTIVRHPPTFTLETKCSLRQYSKC